MAPDFFSYFDNTSPLLWKDSSLYCISAWNDNGQGDHVSEPGKSFIIIIIMTSMMMTMMMDRTFISK